MRKKLSEITRQEWIACQWYDVTEMGDDERIMQWTFKRTPDEAAQAMDEWDPTEEELHEK